MRERRAAAATLGDMRRRSRRSGRAWSAAAVVLALLGGVVAAAPAAGEEATGSEVRIVARKLAGGKVEFGLQQRDADNSWGDRLLPRARLFPTTAPVDRWLRSSPLTLPVGEVRIVARRLAGGKVEFGLQQRDADNSWGDRLLPRARLFPTTAPVDRWLRSSSLTLAAPAYSGSAPAPDEPEPAPAPAPDQPAPIPAHEQAARALLADKVGADPGDFSLESSARVEWSDGGLGCPEPGYHYVQAVTPGYRLVFALDGTSYQVHTNDDGSAAVVCETAR